MKKFSNSSKMHYKIFETKMIKMLEKPLNFINLALHWLKKYHIIFYRKSALFCAIQKKLFEMEPHAIVNRLTG